MPVPAWLPLMLGVLGGIGFSPVSVTGEGIGDYGHAGIVVNDHPRAVRHLLLMRAHERTRSCIQPMSAGIQFFANSTRRKMEKMVMLTAFTS